MSWQQRILVPGAQANTRAMVKNMEIFLKWRGAGLTVRDAVAKAGLQLKTYEKWRDRFPDFRYEADMVTVAIRQQRNETIPRNDFAGFRLRYFKHMSPPFHLRMIDALERSKPGSVTMILVPPNHGKTTLLTDWVCQKLAVDPNHRILYISESSKLAAKTLGRIKRRMTDMNVAAGYIREFGPFYQPGQEKMQKPWAAEMMTVFKSDHDEQDYSLEAMGWVSQIYGTRADTIVLDDYQTLRTAEKGNTTEAMVDKFQQDIYTRIDPDEGRIIIIGTRVAQDDFYVRLLDQGEVINDIIQLPAIDWNGNALWEDRLPIEKLENIKKKVGTKIWSRAYMMQPLDDGAATFETGVLEDCRNVSIAAWAPPEAGQDVWAGLDPAIDKYTAMTVAAIKQEELRLMMSDHWYELATGEAIMNTIYRVWQKTHFTKLIVEAVSFQKALARDERLERMRRECGFQIVEHVTSVNKQDQTFGFARMASSFIDSTIIIPWADEESKAMFSKLIAELVAWRATIPVRLRTQDMGMSLWFVWLKWQQFRKAALHASVRIQTQGVPYKPTQYKAGLLRYGGSYVR